ncbi:MAG: ATP phosphoribosyltransferase regulatory subunit [Bacillota bacterium]
MSIMRDRRGRERRALEGAILELFERRGFTEVEVPWIEPLGAVDRGFTEGIRQTSYRILDHSGEVLVLRPDFTAPIAKMAATTLKSEPRPLRICYSGSVFRRGGPSPGGHKLYQAGVELIGSGEGEADAEVVTLAAECMQVASLTEYRIVLGHAAIASVLLDLSPDRQKAARALECRDLRALEELGALTGLGDVICTRGPASVLDKALGKVTDASVGSAIRRLKVLADALEAAGLGSRVKVDLGLVRDLGYYTGPVFEIYCPGLGTAVAGGGRYDGLVGVFGDAEPATGFALEINKLLAVPVGTATVGLTGIH